MKKKTKKLFWNFARSYLGIGWHDLLQIQYVDLPSSGASLQQIWLNLGKWFQSYIGVKITFFVFLSIYSWCDTTASWATWQTTVCLDQGLRGDEKLLERFRDELNSFIGLTGIKIKETYSKSLFLTAQSCAANLKVARAPLTCNQVFYSPPTSGACVCGAARRPPDRPQAYIYISTNPTTPLRQLANTLVLRPWIVSITDADNALLNWMLTLPYSCFVCPREGGRQAMICTFYHPTFPKCTVTGKPAPGTPLWFGVPVNFNTYGYTWQSNHISWA